MSASVISEPMAMSTGPDGPVNKLSGQNEVDFVKCDCCGLTEEFTPSYIQTIRDRYGGKLICGLCAEAVNDEVLRGQKGTSPDEAMARHLRFCNEFRASSPPQDPTVHLIRAMRRVLRKSFQGPKSMPSSPTTKRGDLTMEGTVLARAESCIPSLTFVDASMYRGIVDEDGDEFLVKIE